jgi:hypothetical protein
MAAEWGVPQRSSAHLGRAKGSTLGRFFWDCCHFKGVIPLKALAYVFYFRFSHDTYGVSWEKKKKQRRVTSENEALTCATGILFSEMHHLSLEENFCPRRHPANTLRNICKCFMDL